MKQGLLKRGVLLSCFLFPAMTFAASAVSVKPSTVKPRLSPSKYLVDLTNSHWCFDCTTDILDKYGVMVGFSDHTFRGDRPVTRYELTTTLLKVQKKLFRAQNLSLAYPDVDSNLMIRENHWARENALELLNKRGLVLLWSDDFKGSEPATREDLAYGLSEVLRAFEEKNGRYLKAPERVSQLGIDLPLRSPYYTAIQKVLNQSLMNLYSDHTFRSEQKVTRYALAASLCKLFGQTLD